MTQIFYHNPGQMATIVLETFNINGSREDSATLPMIDRVILPSLTLAADYPQDMIKLDTGLYYYKFTLPVGAGAVGTYIVDVSYIDPISQEPKQMAFQVVATAAAGNFGLKSA
jgi:hypothetical protein